MAGKQKNAKTPDKRPARQRYWQNRKLEKNKINNLVKHCGMEAHAAKLYWRAARQGRTKFSINL